MAELRTCSKERNYLEDGLQNVPLLAGVVNANGASTNLTAIQNQVIMLPTHLRPTRRRRGGVCLRELRDKDLKWACSLYSTA